MSPVTETRRTLEILAVALVITVGAVWAIGRSSERETAARVRAEMRDSVAFEVAMAVAPLRKVAADADSARLAAEAKLAKVRQSARVTLDVTDSVSSENRRWMADSSYRLNSESALQSEVALQDALRRLGTQLSATDSVSAAFRAYIAVSDTALAAANASNHANLKLALGYARSLEAMTQARDAWRQAATCRVRLVFTTVGCPTRTQAFVGGAVVALAAVVVLR